MYDVTALGELLIDFSGSGSSSRGNPLFEANPGGAPCNALAMLARLGRKTAFIGKVGEDMLGHMLERAVSAAGIDTTGLRFDSAANTTLAFVHTDDSGDRDFSFFRNPGADTLLRPDELPADIIASSRIFHFGTLSLTHQPAKSATTEAVAMAKKAGALISFDPNLRPPLWADQNDARREMEWGCAQCDILKIADDELVFMAGRTDLRAAAQSLRSTYPNIKLLCVTRGSDGADAYHANATAYHPAYSVDTIDTTGAGDTFCGCILSQILDTGLDGLTTGTLTEILRFANAAASLTTTRTGALRSMPTVEEIAKLVG